MKIAVRMPNWIGDAVMALPVLAALRTNYPEAEIWTVAQDWVKDLFSPRSAVNGLIQIPDIRDLKSLREAGSRLKPYQFDVGLLLTNSFSSALLFYMAGIPERWGYGRDGRSVILSRSVAHKDEDGECHMIDFYLGLLSGLGLKTGPPAIDFNLSAEEKAEAAKSLIESGHDPAKSIVIFNPGAAYGPAKRWPVNRFVEAARLFQSRKNAEIVLVGSSAETETAQAISAPLESKPLVFTGRTSLRQLMGLISQAKLFVTNDTGPMHIANALGIPIVAIFGPTDPKVSGPFQKPAAVLKKNVPCWPCTYRSCPYDHRCMNRIEAEEAFLAGQDFL